MSLVKFLEFLSIIEVVPILVSLACSLCDSDFVHVYLGRLDVLSNAGGLNY